jgi:hypothetical protein
MQQAVLVPLVGCVCMLGFYIAVLGVAASNMAKAFKGTQRFPHDTRALAAWKEDQVGPRRKCHSLSRQDEPL